MVQVIFVPFQIGSIKYRNLIITSDTKSYTHDRKTIQTVTFSGKRDRLTQIIKETVKKKLNTSEMTWKSLEKKNPALELSRQEEMKDTINGKPFVQTPGMTTLKTPLGSASLSTTSTRMTTQLYTSTPLTKIVTELMEMPTSKASNTESTTMSVTLQTRTSIKHDKEVFLTFGKYDTTGGNIFQGGNGGTGNLMFQMASTLGIAVKLSRKPFFSLHYQSLSKIFPHINNLTFISSEIYAKLPGIHKTEIEAGHGIYNNDKFIVQKHSEENLVIGYYLQSYRYFEHINKDIRFLFSLSDELRQKAKDMLNNVTRLNPTLSQKEGK